MSLDRRRETVDRKHPKFPIVRQCALLGVSRHAATHGSRRQEPGIICA